MTGSFRLRIGIISVVIGGHFGGGDHFDGGDHFGGGTGAHFLHCCRKKEYSDPHFLFHNFNKNSASFKSEKNLQKSMTCSVFWQFYSVVWIEL